jgi:hypothetical protein
LRLQQVSAGGPGAISAAWAEVLAESADRGVRHPAGENVRRTAQRLASEHELDEPGREGLRILVGAVERSWYGTADSTTTEDITTREVPSALAAVRSSMARCAPTATTARLLPGSVLRRRR